MAAFALAINLPALVWPLARDGGIFSYNAALLLEGGIPYLDFVDQKPPGILFLYALPLGLFGRRMWGVHLLALAAILAAALAAHALGRRFGRPETGPLAGLLTALLLGPLYSGFWSRGQIEVFLAVLYGLILLLLLAPPRPAGGAPCPGPGALFLAGLLGGACACLKPNAAGYPLLAGGLAAFEAGRAARARGRPGGLGSAAGAAALFAAGFLLLPGALAGWLSAHGALGAMWEQMLSINTTYIEQGSGNVLVRFLWTQLPTLSLAAAAAAGLLLLALRRGPPALTASVRGALGPPGERARRAVHLAALWAGGLAMVLSGGFLFPYHYLVLALPGGLTLALLITALGGPLLDRLSARGIGRGAMTLAAGAACLIATGAGLHAEDRRFLLGGLTLEEYHGSARFDWDDFSFRDDRALAREIARRTRPGERVQIFGHGSLALFLADRRAATRFSHTPAAMDPRYGRGGMDREEILERLRGSPPPLVVITTNDPLPKFKVRPSDEQVLAFPPLARFLEEAYAPDGRTGDYRILARRDPLL